LAFFAVFNFLDILPKIKEAFSATLKFLGIFE
jgi:hypothetical protein